MRLNQFLARHTTLSRRQADEAITAGRVTVNGEPAELGQGISDADVVAMDGTTLQRTAVESILLHKPVGYICSRVQQGQAPTVYALLRPDQQHLRYLGRLDKDSSGLLVMTNDGALINAYAHPRYKVEKVYHVMLSTPLTPEHRQQLTVGVALEDGPSKLELHGGGREWEVRLREGRNRQIRRSFAALGYQVTALHRSRLGNLELGELAPGKQQPLSAAELAL